MEGLRNQGIKFDTAALSALGQLDEGAQAIVLQTVLDYIRDPSALLMHLIRQIPIDRNETRYAEAQANRGLDGCAERDAVTALWRKPCPAQPESVFTDVFLEGQPPTPQSAHARGQQPLHADSSSCGSVSIPQTPPSQNLMCQSEHGVAGCSQTVSGCTYGAVEPHEVEHALTLVSSDLAYITVCRARRVESFPWKLPAGWYALHVAQGGLNERLRRKVAGTRIVVPANLPADCIIAVIRLASPKPRWDFDGNPWALGQ